MNAEKRILGATIGTYIPPEPLPRGPAGWMGYSQLSALIIGCGIVRAPLTANYPACKKQILPEVMENHTCHIFLESPGHKYIFAYYTPERIHGTTCQFFGILLLHQSNI